MAGDGGEIRTGAGTVMREERIVSDVTVCGAGLSGICAAIAAARSGCQVALVHNRPVLGGNSSSEVRVWVSGANAVGVNRYARETGIMGELFLENQYRNAEGNPYLWDLVLLEAVKAEPNIRLFLNTNVYEVEATGEPERRSISSVVGWMLGSERRIVFESPQFLDCTGDGLIGELAGALYRIGRESKHEFGEALAPDEADSITLGSTILFYTKDAGRPVRFVPPSFARNIEETSIPIRRVIRSGDSGCHYWWIEWGGELDAVHENERIRDELWAAIYGIWNYIKNSGKFQADTLTLEWVGAVPGKREYRRFVGEAMLTQNDIIAQTPFPDRVAFGGWSIDLHPPQGMYAAEGGSKHLHPDGIYHIPFGCLYSKNVENLLFAGRNISATHIAFGTTRVMATCAVMGEAAGTGAALCVRKRMNAGELHRGHIRELQQTLLRNDASIIGVPLDKRGDWAGEAAVAASSCLRRLEADGGDAAEACRLDRDAALLLPAHPSIKGLELLVSADADAELIVELWDTGRPENYIPHCRQRIVKIPVARGGRRWVPTGLDWRPDRPQNAFVIVRSDPRLSLYAVPEPLTGVLSFLRLNVADVPDRLEDRRMDQPVIAWSMKPFGRKTLCFRMASETEAYAPSQAANGWLRPYGGPQLWSSAPMSPGVEEWLEFAWEEERTLREARIVFNDDVNEYLNNLHFLRTEFDVFPELVRAYRIEVWSGVDWKRIDAVNDNRRRMRIHRWAEPVTTRRLRIVVAETNGSDRAEIAEVMLFSEPSIGSETDGTRGARERYGVCRAYSKV